ncbi:MAG: aminotransferase class V-fold PLP-dependent enzyme [Candidatus Aegiribacteria sp.]|nr:aminotransferase class V-fold PLP-dependent enzyme [Candidatus Aegiribacteria sp.]
MPTTSDLKRINRLKNTTYLDNLTVTPLSEKAERAVSEALRQGYGHPRSTNLPGRRAQKVLEDLKDRTARFFGGSRVMFCCDGSVANGLSVLSAGRLAREAGRGHIAASPVERSSVVAALKILRSEGSTVSVLKTDDSGRIIPESLSETVSDETGLVTCAWVNGISGTVQPVREIAKTARSAGAWFHTDACDAAGRIEIDISDTDIDLITVCSLKIGGPPGAAAVVMSDVEPWFMSAVPEFLSMPNIPGISGMVAAMDVMGTGIEPRTRIVNQLRRGLLEGLDSFNVRYSIIGGGLENILPGTALLNISHAPEKLHLILEKENIILPSHNSTDRLSYLDRTGWDISNPDRYRGFSIDVGNTTVDVEHFLRSFSKIYITAKDGRGEN